jgi:hypothetical protein
MPAYYYLGQPFRDELTVEDVSGALVDPTTVLMSLRYPDGSTVAGPAAVRDSLGKYHADLNLPVAGRYRRLWTTTGPGAGIDVLDIVMTDPLADQIVSLAGVKRHLNIDEANDSFDVELNEFLAALPPVIEQLAGPVLPVARTETAYGWPIVVKHPPIASVTAVTGYGGLVSLAGLEIDKPAGIIQPVASLTPPYLSKVTTVSYVSGYTEVPAAINLAARIIVEHWWESQRAKPAGGRADRRDAGDTIDVPGLGFAIPRYAAELLQPFNPGTGLH